MRPVPAPAGAFAPSLSPDGQKLAFSLYVDSSGDIYSMNHDGSGLTPLTSGPGWDNDSDWSPDGARIAFVRDSVVSVMDADGSDVDTAPRRHASLMVA